MDSILVSVLGAQLADIRNLSVSATVEWNGGIGKIAGFIVKGTLPSGALWEVPLSINVEAIYHHESGAWLSSIEAAREVRKVIQSFRAMVALIGEQSKRSNSNHRPSLFGSSLNPFQHVIKNSFEIVEHPDIKATHGLLDLVK